MKKIIITLGLVGMFACPSMMFAQNVDQDNVVYSSTVLYRDIDGYIQIVAEQRDKNGKLIVKVDDWYRFTVRFDKTKDRFLIKRC